MFDFTLIEDSLGRDELDRRRVLHRNDTPTDPRDWRAALGLEIEILIFITLVYGINHTGLLTLIFSRHRGRPPTPVEAQDLFRRAWRHLLPQFFPAYIAILDFHRSGQIHLHLVVALKINMRDGWDFGVDQQHRELQKVIREQKRRATPDELKRLRFLARRLTTNPEVKAMWRDLRVGLEKLGFAADYPFELKPVRHAKKLARYLALRFRQSKASAWRPPGCRCRRFSNRYQRHVDQKLRLSAVGPGATRYRQKKGAVARAFGISDNAGMIQEFGPSWEHSFREILRPVNPCGPDGFFAEQMECLNERVNDWRRPYWWVRCDINPTDPTDWNSNFSPPGIVPAINGFAGNAVTSPS